MIYTYEMDTKFIRLFIDGIKIKESRITEIDCQPYIEWFVNYSINQMIKNGGI
jgi:hypothetical protein